MPTTHDTAYSARFVLPDMLQRDHTNALQVQVYRDGALAVPTSGTWDLLQPNGTSFDDGSVTVSASIARATVALPETVALGEGWTIEWKLRMPDGIDHTFVNEASVVRRRLYAPITDADLFRVMSSLDPDGDSSITRKSDYQDYIDEAWVQIQLRLIEKGNRPNLVVSNTALREITMNLTLALIFADMETRLNEAYEGIADRYHGRYERNWARVQLTYSQDDAETHATNRRRPATQSLWLGTRRN